MSKDTVQTARARIANCLQLDEQGRLVQRRDYLNLSGLELTVEELNARFVPRERDLPEIGLSDLIHLRYLDLTGNRLAELPECITTFTGLVWLGLNFNQITKLPESISALANLQRLYLRGNKFAALPEGLGNLRSLVELDLTGCKIALLPASMHLLESLEYIELEEKVLAPDLRAAWKEKGWKTLREHLKRAAKEFSLPQFTGKVVLVGSQENGKTCLQRALRGEPFVEGLGSTDGMSRERMYLRLNGEFVSPQERAKAPGPQADMIDLTLWDMGGQESYQHTHQMFFTPSAVYLLVTLARHGGGVQGLDKWIELVKRRTAGEATVIVVSTWCRKYPPDKAITLTDLQAKHGRMIRGLVAVDSQDGSGIQELRALIATEVQEPRAKCRHTWLPGWAKVLDELANAAHPFLRWGAIRDICAKHQISDTEQQRQVIRTGHYTGALLWREDIPAGEEVVILNPDWLCRAVARLLDDEDTKTKHGLVDIPDLGRVWSGTGRDGTPGYEPYTYPALIELMEINELAYRPKEPGKTVGEGKLLLVTQMVEDPPPHDLEAKWQEISPRNGAETVRVIAFRQAGSIGYEEVPDIIYLLIFRLREFSLGRSDYQEARHWQQGLLVTDDYGSAGRIELQEQLLRITLRHRLGDGLMHSIVHRIGVKDDSYWSSRGLEKVDFVPCGRVCSQGTPDAGLISMEDCAEADRAGNQSVRCETCRKYVPIQDLLNLRAHVPSDLQNLYERLADLEANLMARIRDEGEATRQDIANLQQLIQMLGDGILEAFTSEWKKGPRLFSLVPIIGSNFNPRNWTELKFRVTVWCEASRRPVPFFGELKDKPGSTKEIRGSEIITLTRDWVQSARKALTWGSWAAWTLATGGAGAVTGLVTATGGFIDPKDAKELANEIGRQQKAFKDIATAIPDQSKNLLRGERTGLVPDQPENPFSAFGNQFGTPEEDDLKLIRFLRDEFEQKDPDWGGLKPRNDGKFGRIWAHPKSTEV